MADERVVIRIDVDADTSDISRVQAQLATLAGSSEAADRSTSRTSASLNKMDGNSRRLSGSLDDNNNAFRQMNSRLTALAGGSGGGGGSMGRVNRQMGNMNNNAKRSRRSMRYLMYAVLGVGIEFAIVAGSLSLVNAGFAIGNFAAKTYQGSLALAAGAAAGFTVALASAAAAQREFQAAMFATTYKSLPNLGNGTQQAMSALRMLTNDSSVAVFGMESLQQAFAAVSKNTEMTAPLKNALVGIGDFAVAAGGDMGKNFAAAGDFIGLLQKEGKLTDNVLSAAGKVGPQFEKAVKDAQKAGISGAPQLLAALSSGKLAEDSGIGGALGAVNNTLIGQLKSFMTEARSSFADFGQLFLPQLKATFKGISHELNGSFMRIQAAIGPTMGGGMIDGFGKGIVRLVEVLTRLFEDNLPKVEGTFNSIYGFMKRTWTFLTSLDDIFAPFREGSRIINQTFGPPIVAILMHFVDSFKTLNKLAVDNEDAFLNFGKMLERTINFISDVLDLGKEIFTDNLEAITATMNTLLTVAEALLGIVKGLAAAGRGLGPVGSILSLGLLAGGVQGFQMLGNAKRGIRGGKTKPTLLGRAGRAAARRPGMVAGGATLLGQVPIMGQAPEWAQTAGMMGSSASMMARKPKTAMRIGLASMSIPYLATAMGSQTLLGGLFSGGVGGASLGASIGSFTGNPLIGAGAGAAIGSTIGGIRGAVNQFDLSPQAGLAAGAGAGLAGGAAAGALIGSIVPGAGTALGAGVGAIIGVVVGGITGLVSGIQQDREHRDKIRKAFEQVGLEQAKGLGGVYLQKGLPGVEKSIGEIVKANEEIDRIAGGYRGLTLGERKTKAEDDVRAGRITQTQFDVLTVRNMDTAINQLKENSENLEDQALKAFKNVDANLKQLTATTGMSQQAMYELSDQMGVDLTDNTLDLSEALDRLGLAIPQTTDEIYKSIRRLAIDSMNTILRPIIEKEEAVLAMDQAAIEVQQAGGFTGGQAQMAKFLQTVIGGNLARFKDPFRALAGFERGFASGEGTAYTDPRSPFFGRYEQLGGATGEFQTLTTEAMNAMRTDVFGSLGATAATSLSGLPGQDFKFDGADFAAIFTEIQNTPGVKDGTGTEFAGLFTTELNKRLGDKDFRDAFGKLNTPEARAEETGRVIKDVTAFVKATFGGQLPGIGAIGEQTTVEVPGLGTFSNDVLGVTSTLDQAAKGVRDELGKMGEAVKNGITAAFSSPDTKPEWWKLPPWWNAPGGDTTAPRNMVFPHGTSAGPAVTAQFPGGDPNRLGITTMNDDGGDTTSSRLARTLMSHSQLNGQLPGKRSITSSWRNTNLGSLNSDHVTGNAYDLVGQNLVGYAALVNSSGGFAEFHGSGGDRHLHVVPGAAPYGDAVSPMGATGTSSPASYNSNYSIVVNASPNQDVSAIANEVMNKIEDKERQMMERS